MASATPHELAQFHEFVGRKLHSDQANLSPEEALDLWRAANPSVDEAQDATTAVREALAELAAGERGVSIEEFDGAFRRRHNLDRAK